MLLCCASRFPRIIRYSLVISWFLCSHSPRPALFPLVPRPLYFEEVNYDSIFLRTIQKVLSVHKEFFARLSLKQMEPSPTSLLLTHSIKLNPYKRDRVHMRWMDSVKNLQKKIFYNPFEFFMLYTITHSSSDRMLIFHYLHSFGRKEHPSGRSDEIHQ